MEREGDGRKDTSGISLICFLFKFTLLSSPATVDSLLQFKLIYLPKLKTNVMDWQEPLAGTI
jgi:hypothetical protein